MKKYWLLLALVAALLIWWGIGRGSSPVVLHFSSARRATIESIVSTNGKVEPAEWAAARAQTAGVVRSVAVQKGDNLKAGQELVALDTTSAQTDLAAALAKKGEAQGETDIVSQGGKASALANLNDSIASAQVALTVARRMAEATDRLVSHGAATAVQAQEAKDAVDRAQLHLTALENQKKTLVTPVDRSVAGARLHDAEAGVALARHRLELGRIVAPIAGTLYQFDLKIGSYLQPGDLVGLVGKLDQMKVIVYVDEPDLGRVGLDMPVNITWDARLGRKWKGHVNKLPTEVIALGTRTVGEVTTIVDNPDHDLLPGVSVNAQIVSKVVVNALAIPRPALRTLNGATGVYKLAGNVIAWIPISAGVSDVNNVQVTSGLQLEDKVVDHVIDPNDAEIKAGMRVKALID